MLVFNDRGAAGYIDVVLMEYPDHMQPLDEFLEKACMEGDKERIRKLLTEFCQMPCGCQRQPGSRGDPRIERDDRQGLFGASGQLRVHADGRDRTLRITNRFGTPTT